MNKSTFKKVAALTLVAAFGGLSAFAQDGGAKVFGGAKQFRTWSIGINGGVAAPVIFLGGHNDYNEWDANFGYGAYIQKQITHAFGLKLDYQGGKVSGTYNGNTNGQVNPGFPSFETTINYAASLQAQIDLTSLLLKRDSKVALYVQGGYGLTGYDPGDGAKRTEQFIPVGGGLKFKLSEGINLDLGYTMNFLDADNLDRTWFGPTNDKWSYGYAGLSFALGNKSKKNLDWVNPYALMYDELKDNELRQEVEALKSRVAATEGDVSNIKKDSDGDGVSDVFDKEPNTPAGNVVDGAGRTIVFPKQEVAPTPEAPSNTIQFDFNSDKLRPESAPAIENLASELKSSNGKLLLEGHASAEGTEAYNMDLSKRRATSVKKALVKAGVKSGNITTKGYGETRPVASNDTEEGRQKNRRVEFKQQ
ncbi:OmpA family protein [Solitalea canadensis]|uniref:Outer membrane protein/peptidoglycan-associated (Lipo)protein n=1 Tax=Solitalea canadensis (strain ATCC 29591 / DSM 3403 / JCM 21819 / LMG 8368 / NBRC 15130 / NCIMB 12057 / USAM 9D) TaxID=929556 RepID=H8KXF1_SOLCM|nr:OmpA family protein [Solitalea canadensis]AFD08480.1 outer membrane protein/peptidoglycan-associated (lipo)protein [Solitalea canadensis DSM 3403]